MAIRLIDASPFTRAGLLPPHARRLPRALHTTIAYVAVSCAGLVLHLSLSLPAYSLTDRIAAWLLLVLFLAALRGFLRRETKSVPVLPLVSAQIYLFYGAPQFIQDGKDLLTGHYVPPAAALSWAILLVVAGEAIFLVTYSTTIRLTRGGNFFDVVLPKPRPAWRNAVFAYLVPSLVLYATNMLRPTYIPIVMRMAVLQIFNVYLALAILLYLSYHYRDRLCLLLALGLIAAMGIAGFIHGAMAHIVFPVFIVFLSAWLWAGAIRTRWLILAIAVTLVVNPAKNRFRELAWDDKDVSSLDKVASRLEDWGRAFEDRWVGRQDDLLTENLNETASRTCDLVQFAQAVDYVPGQIPYRHGEGMGISFFYWVPRVFWTSKPESADLLYNRYAVEFDYSTTEGTLTTTTGASIFIEAYWHFGKMGVFIYLGGAGILLALLMGQNGVRGQASALASMTYLGGTFLLLQPLTVAIPAAVTFSGGLFIATWGIEYTAHLLHLRPPPVRSP